MKMEAVDSSYAYSVADGYSLYRGVARFIPFNWITDYGTVWNLIVNDDASNKTADLSHSAMGNAGVKRSAYEFLQDWRTLRKEHEGKQDSICWLLEHEARLGEVIDSYEGASAYLSGVTDIDGVTIEKTIKYLRSVSGGTSPGGEPFRAFSGGKEEGTLYLLGGTLLLGLFAAGGYFIYRKKARRGL